VDRALCDAIEFRRGRPVDRGDRHRVAVHRRRPAARDAHTHVRGGRGDGLAVVSRRSRVGRDVRLGGALAHPARVRGKLARFVATGAYTGYAPVIPGTFGTLPGVALAPLFAALCAQSTALYALALLTAILVAIWAADIVVDQEGNSDPQIIV